VRTPAARWVVEALNSGVPRRQKWAVQSICDSLEAGWPIDVTRDPRIAAGIARLRRTSDTTVLRWLYKLVGLTGDRLWRPWLEGQLARDSDPENISWAAGALSTISPRSAALAVLDAAGHQVAGTALELAPRYFDGGPPVDDRLIRDVMDDDDPLRHQWLGLLQGKDPTLVGRSVVATLNVHPDPIVVEYSIWAVFRDPAGRLADLALKPQDVPVAPPNVRRWYYRLLAKDSAALMANYELVEHAVLSDDSPAAREGLALGLLDIYPGDWLARDIVDWFARETDPMVRLALLRHFERNASRNRLYEMVWEFERAKLYAHTETALFDDAPLGGLAEREEPYPVDQLHVVSDRTEQVFLVAVDAVGFSLNYDTDQVAVFRALLDEVSDTAEVRAAPADDFVHLLTGDGFIAGFIGAQRRLDPLRVAIQLRAVTERRHHHQLRFGVHAGPARLLRLSDGSPQLIAAAVNWSARVCAAATPNQVLVSEPYYQTYVQPEGDKFPGYSFDEVEGLADKHGVEIKARAVRPPAGG
jgi:class 3 adenylate cyclase